MTKKVVKQNEEIFAGAVEKIHVSNDPPYMVVIAGPCRVGTTALTNVFAHAGYTSYMQPIKSIRRAIEEGDAIPEFNVSNSKNVVVVKETFGAKSESEYFDPVEALIAAGYPRDRIHLIGIMREPMITLTSWTWMWEEVLLNGFVKAYKQTEEVLNKSRALGVKTTHYIHEAIRDNSSEKVVGKLFDRLFGGVLVSNRAVDWSRGPNFDSDQKVKFFDEPPERFVHAIKTWGGYEYRHLKPDITREQKIILQKEGVFEIYNRFATSCESDLGIKIRKNVEIKIDSVQLETKDI